MENSDRKLMLAIGKRLGEIEKRLTLIEKKNAFKPETVKKPMPKFLQDAPSGLLQVPDVGYAEDTVDSLFGSFKKGKPKKSDNVVIEATIKGDVMDEEKATQLQETIKSFIVDMCKQEGISELKIIYNE